MLAILSPELKSSFIGDSARPLRSKSTTCFETTGNVLDPAKGSLSVAHGTISHSPLGFGHR
eukprot:910557-Pleurochrysis_carterae.AAC.1